MKKVVIFGVFDGLHDGHREFIKQASMHGEVYAIVARDSVVMELKNKIPKQKEGERVSCVGNSFGISHATLGDEHLGHYEVLKAIRPDTVFLGYDQDDLARDIKDKIKNNLLPEMQIIKGEPYKADIYHTSLLAK